MENEITTPLQLALAEAKRHKEESDKRRKQDHATAVATVKQMIALYDMTAEDLGYSNQNVQSKKRIKKDGTEDTRQAVRPKYIGPEPGDTWAGRGITPKWITALIEKGAKLEDFAVDKQVANSVPQNLDANDSSNMEQTSTQPSRLPTRIDTNFHGETHHEHVRQ